MSDSSQILTRAVSHGRWQQLGSARSSVFGSTSAGFGCGVGCAGCAHATAEAEQRLRIPRRTLLAATLRVFGVPLLLTVLTAGLAAATGQSELVMLAATGAVAVVCCIYTVCHRDLITSRLSSELRMESLGGSEHSS